jgi:predicted ATPase/DNA-binding SARP family transcriptional activator
VQVKLLDGPAVVRVEGGSDPQSLGGGRRAHLVLAALALSPGPVPGERLAALVWRDPPATWRVALRGIVASLRAGVAGDLVETTPLGYRLATGVTTDAAELETTVGDAVRLLAEGRHRAAIDLAGPAAGTSGDRLLPGLEADWLGPHRARVDALALQAGGLVVEAAGRIGDHGRAIAVARAMVAGHPLDERAYRALIAALDGGGDRAGAVLAFEECRTVLIDQMGVDPTSETVAVYLRALRDQPAAGQAVVPRFTSSFVGRERELAELVDAVARPGLVTVTGPGGVGKSRLVAEAVAGVRQFPGGRWWVSLATVFGDALVSSAVALRLGVSPGADDATGRIADRLAGLGRCLLVVDGCDSVVDGAASLVTSLLADCPGLVVVVTGRTRLGLADERVVRVEPLALPGQDGGGGASVLLLGDRVREGGGELVLTAELAPYVDALCRRCAGLPLALELVAAQLTELSPGDLVDHIDEVADEGADALRSIVEGSYALLDAEESAVFRRLAVLDGGCELDLIKAVVSDPSVPGVRVVRILRELTARGLLGVDRAGAHWHYRLDDDLRRTAAERLAEEGEATATFGRLQDAVLAKLPDDPRSPPALYAVGVTAVLDSVRSLLGAGIDGPPGPQADRDGCLQLAFRLHRYWAATSVAEGRFWLSRLLADGPPTRWSPYAAYALGYLSYWAGDTTAAVVELEAAVDALAGVDDAYVARALIYLGGLLDDQDRGLEAVECVRRAIEAAAPYGADLQVAAAMGLGSVAAERGDPEAAGHAARAIALCEVGASKEQLAATLPTAAMVCWQVGDLDRCREFVERAEPLLAEGRRIARVVLLSTAAGLSLADGDVEAAVRSGTAADEDATELGVERELPLIRSVLALALLDRGEVAAASAAAAAAIDAALRLGYDFPLAGALEAVAAVGRESGIAPAELGRLVTSARSIRDRGDRPVPAPLASRIADLVAALPDSIALEPREAAVFALDLLAGARAG